MALVPGASTAALVGSSLGCLYPAMQLLGRNTALTSIASLPRTSNRVCLPHANRYRQLSSAAEPAREEHVTTKQSTGAPAMSPAAAAAVGKPGAKKGAPAPLVDIDVARFVQDHYKPYHGDGSFLAGPTKRTEQLWKQVEKLICLELEKGVLDVDPSKPSTITSFGPGYIDKANEVIVGLQTDAPLKRAIKPLGGINMVKAALEAYGFKPDPQVEEMYTKVRKTHNSGVFDAYTSEMRAARKNGILTGLPDGYGRGRIIGDYRRVALYGVDALLAQKKADLARNLLGVMDEEKIRLREEVNEQIRALNELKEMAAGYGFDLSRPAANAREAIQWLYFSYLAAVKEQDGAAMSLGRIDAFLDTYIERDLASGAITEAQAQEMIDDMVMKLRIVRQLRTPEYNALFAGDPTWVTVGLGGCDANGQPMVTKTSFRLLNTLYNLGPAPEPNMTVLWSPKLPKGWKEFCAKVSLDTSSVQYENDGMMRGLFGSDYSIACCVSAMRIGKDMQYFGARANLPKLLLYTMNQGRDEITGDQVGPKFGPLTTKPGEPLNFEDIKERMDKGMDWLASLYCNTMNIIHYMHDKYDYERIQMALHDTHVRRLLAFGISGLSVVADSLSAIKFAQVTPVYDERGITVDFKVEGEFPKFHDFYNPPGPTVTLVDGTSAALPANVVVAVVVALFQAAPTMDLYGNDDDRVDELAEWVATSFNDKLKKQHTYRNSIPTLSVLTITSNVVYGKKTGTTPDGRKAGQAFAPGANPLHGRDASGALASLNSVAKIPYTACLDGVSNTFSLIPQVLGKGTEQERCENLASVLDGYFEEGGHHLNVNVLTREMLMDAVDHPDKYPNLTIRVSGYAVHFARLTREQQLEVIARTFHDTM